MIQYVNMTLIVGLGNPGKRYEKTWHNIGFLAIEEFSKQNDFSDFSFSKKFNAELSEGLLGKEKIILAKPQVYMNNSGRAVNQLISKLRIPNSKLIVIHDDIDLPLGKIRIVKNRGPAGHKGVESIIQKLGNKNFIRLRIGIQPKTGKPKLAERFVLQKFTKNNEKAIKETVQRTVLAIETILKQGPERTMSKFNK